MKNKVVTKIISILLAGAVAFGSAPISVFAKAEENVLQASPLDGYVAIHNREELVNINSFPGHKFYLANDIDLAGENWIPIKNFDGIFDGQGHTIKNMTINTDDYVNDDNGYMDCGLFSEIDCNLGYEVRVCNLNLENVSITANDTACVGAVVGSVTMGNRVVTFDNITVSGRIEASGDGAGLIGSIYNYDSGYAGSSDEKVVISNCTNNAEVTCGYSAAGIIENVSCETYNLEISDCTNNGSIYGDNSATGIAARIDAYNATIREVWSHLQ